MESSAMETISSVSFHSLSDKWVLWAHLPHDTDWSLKSYIKIMRFDNLENLLMLQRAIPEKMVKNCMLFMMKSGINPTWEDPKNKDGGCFSFKISNKNVYDCWNQLLIGLVNNNISKNDKFLDKITGVTISPKKTFCIIKVWMESVQYQSVMMMEKIEFMNVHGCIFKRHNEKG
tara:strand:+ start:389 stop:910 length:522 start_codon:yes stop_codon:yes gene_type:complete